MHDHGFHRLRNAIGIHRERLVEALRCARAATGGPCAACAAARGAPLCTSCRRASLLTTQAWSTEVAGDALFFLGAYHAASGRGALSPLGRALRSFKDHGNRHAGRSVAELFAAALVPCLEEADVVAAVPSDPSRLRERGLAPAAWFARALARARQVPVGRDFLLRRPGHPPQRGLDGAARRLNAARAFALGPSRVAGYRVVLVDDVVTTGATLAACSRLLVEAGAASVVCTAVACADDAVIAECRSKTVPAGRKSTAAPRR